MNNYEDIYKCICRVCLCGSKSENMVSLFEESNSYELSCYGKSLITFANISINYYDNLPKMMCGNCLLLLKQAIHFKFKCETSDNRLKELMEMEDQSSDNIKEIVCQYTIFKHYFPEECPTVTSRSVLKANGIGGTKKLKQKIGDSSKKFDRTSMTKKCLTTKTKQLKRVTNTAGGTKEIDSDDLFDKLEQIMNSNIDISSTDYTFNKKHTRKVKTIKLEQTVGSKTVKKENHISQVHNLTSTHKIPDKKNYIDNEDTNSEDIFDKLENIINSDIDLNPEKMKRIQRIGNNRKQKNINCKLCDKILANPQTYEHHMQRHTGCRYICDSCGKGFPTKAELNLHQVARHGTGLYLQCNYCSYKAPRKINLVEHIRLHTGERPYTCDKCGLTFRRQAIWRNHLVFHTERNIQCPHCPKKFYRQADKLAHMNNIHERVYVFMCNKCGVTYAKSKTVRSHLSEKHGIPREMQGKVIRVTKGAVEFPNK